jgi:putative transcription factor
MSDLTCEICGRNGAVAIVLIEGAKLATCGSCSRGGKTLYRLYDEEEHQAPVAVKRRAPMETEEIVDDFDKIIKNAREKRGLPLEVIAEKLNEKQSYLHAIEHGRMSPTLAVAKKLEKELGIKLIEKVTEDMTPLSEKGTRGSKELTLADMVEEPKKKKAK